MLRVLIIAGWFLFSGGASAQQFYVAANGAQFVSPLKIGGGGWLVGGDVCADGSALNGERMARTDTFGDYLLAPGGSVWMQLLSQTTLPANLFGFVGSGTSQVDEGSLGAGGRGVYDNAFAPSNCNVIYIMARGWIFQSTNNGVSFINASGSGTTSFGGIANTAVPMASNSANRTSGRKMAVDPVNPNIVFAGTDTLGMFTTTDGGADWSAVGGGLPKGTGTVNYNIAFDPTSASGGVTQTIYACTNGSTAGVYISINAGSSWALTSSGPATCEHLVVSSTGVVWVADGAANVGGHIWSAVNTLGTVAWTQHTETNAPTGAHSVSVSPSNAANIVAGSVGGQLDICTLTGTTCAWSGLTTISRTASDVPWLAAVNESFMSNGDMIFDGSTLVFFEGIGVWTTTPQPSTTVWTSVTAGIEQLVGRQVIAPNGVPLVGVSDRANWYLSNPNVYPSNYNAVYHDSFSLDVTWGLDHATTNANFVGAVTGVILSGTNNNSGYSTDGGQTFFPFNSYYQDVAAGALTSNGGLVEIAVASTSALTTWSAGAGSIVRVVSYGGAPSTIRQYWPVTITDGTHITLQGSTFSSALAAAGRYYVYVDTSPQSDNNGVFTVTGTASDGGLIKMSVTGSTAGLLANGMMVCPSGVGGTTEANGCWVASNVNNGANTFDLVSSTFTHAWTSGGTVGKAIIGGGSIGISSPLNMAIVGDSNDYVYCTTDGAQTWTKITLPAAIAANGNTGWTSSPNFNRVSIAADRVTPNTIYLFNQINTGNAYNIYVLTNCSVTATNSGTLNDAAASLQMVTMPGYAGEMIISVGVQGTPGSFHPSGPGVRWSNNQGSTLVSITNTAEARSCGVGAIAPGSDHPTVYCAMWLSNVYGIYRSTSTEAQWAANTVSWTLVTDYPNGSDDALVSVSGDGVLWNKWYACYQGSGCHYGQHSFLLNRDLDPASNDNTSAWLDKAA